MNTIESAGGPQAGTFNLQTEATEWTTAANPSITPDQIKAKLTKVMGTPPKDLNTVDAFPCSGTDDVLGRGHEVEIHFNPVRYWTVTANFTEQQTIHSNLAKNVAVYNEQRFPFWTTIKDPRIDPAVEPAQRW